MSFFLTMSLSSSRPHVRLTNDACMGGANQVWDASSEDHSSQDLAADKRAAIERRLREQDEEEDDAFTK